MNIESDPKEKPLQVPRDFIALSHGILHWANVGTPTKTGLCVHRERRGISTVLATVLRRQNASKRDEMRQFAKTAIRSKLLESKDF